MGRRSQLQTVRFSRDESRLVGAYLRQNHIFESFSALARVATLSFIEASESIPLRSMPRGAISRRPPFLWDYDLTEAHVREILASPGLTGDKRWLVGRILTEAPFDLIWQYLTVAEIARALPSLRLPAKVRARWEYAVERWSRDVRD